MMINSESMDYSKYIERSDNEPDNEFEDAHLVA